MIMSQKANPLKTLSKFIYAWGPPIALMIFIFIMSNRQNLSVSESLDTNFLVFKTLHIFEYAVLMASLARALLLTTRYTVQEVLLVAGLCTMLYGTTDEIHQTYVPSRTGKVHDLMVDSIGVAIVYHLGMKNSRRLKRLIT